MKNKFLLFFIATTVLLTSCGNDDMGVPTDQLSLGSAAVTLTGLTEGQEGLDVQVRNITTGSVFVQKTSASGNATFTITPGIYEASVSASRKDGKTKYIYNGVSGQFTVYGNQQTAVTIPMKQVSINPLVIKELYCGGCMMDDGITSFHFDKCVILYNNSDETLQMDNLCFGMVAPANAQAANNNYGVDGRLNYEDEGFLPLWNGIWYFPSTLTIEPYQQVVVNIHGAINNTLTVSQSVNYANSDYYCMFDPESGYNNQRYNPTPAEVIPSSHYLKAVTYALGNAWPLSNTSPALVLFQTQGKTPVDFASDVTNYWYDGGGAQISKRCVKVPNDWVIDAVEVFSSDYPTQSLKRLTADIDAGYVSLTNKQGHSLCRRIDEEATAASGGHTVYQDTNNSTNDFYEAPSCSLRK